MELLKCDTRGEFRHRSIILECLSFSPSYSLSLLFRAVTARFYGDRSRVFLLRFLSGSHSDEVMIIDVLMMILDF